MIRLKYRLVYQLLKNTSHFSCILNKVLLPDHDFTVGAQHKLIPSVIAVMEILPKKLTGDAVTYNGPTYIATRSGKHTGSSAFHHLTDMKRVRSLTEFEGSEEWKVEHIRESQYFLQIVKCLDSNCCSPFRSSFLTVVKRLTNEKWLKWAKDDKIGTYLSLHQNLIMSANIIPLTPFQRSHTTWQIQQYKTN